VSSEFDSALRRILWELRDYLPEVVVVGGWVPRLYQLYGGFPNWTGQISLTGEVDVLVGSVTASDSRPPLKQLLRAAGFEPVEGTQGAAWQQDPQAGEKIEFLIPNTGPQSWEGSLRPVPGQPEVAAVALDDLRLLARHTTNLNVTVLVAGRPEQTLAVRVPTLGAYVVNKGITFTKRRQHLAGATPVPNPKRGKDLLYIHDVLAGGEAVVTRVTADVRAMRSSDGVAQMMIGRAASQIRLALNERSEPLVACEAMLVERDGYSPTEARARLEGYLRDLVEILEET
jgi:hypothetical protein